MESGSAANPAMLCCTLALVVLAICTAAKFVGVFTLQNGVSFGVDVYVSHCIVLDSDF